MADLRPVNRSMISTWSPTVAPSVAAAASASAACCGAAPAAGQAPATRSAWSARPSRKTTEAKTAPSESGTAAPRSPVSWRPAAYPALVMRASSPPNPSANCDRSAVSRSASRACVPPAGPCTSTVRSSARAEVTRLRAPASTTSRL